MLNILAVGPHPDDVELGMGAMMWNWEWAVLY